MNVGSKQSARMIALGKFVAPFWAHRVCVFDAAGSWFEGRVAKLMAAKAESRRSQQRRCDSLDLDVADRLQPIVHHGVGGNQPSHREGRAVNRADGAREIHQTAAFGVNRPAARDECAHRCDHRMIRGEFVSDGLGITTAEIESVHRGQFAIMHRTEIHDLGAKRFESAQVVFVVEVERVVERDPDTASRRAVQCRVAAGGRKLQRRGGS